MTSRSRLLRPGAAAPYHAKQLGSTSMESPLHRHEEWKSETAELHNLLATAQQRLSISPRSPAASSSPMIHMGSIGTPAAGEGIDIGPGASPMGALSVALPEALPEIPSSTLAEDMRAALEIPDFCDVSLIAEDGEVPAVRAVLACRSNYFRRLLLDSLAPKVNVPDASCAALSLVVTYLMTDTAPEDASDWLVWVEALALAQKWDIERLERIVRRGIGRVLEVDNVVGILIAATQCEIEELENFCVNFIVRHKETVRQKGNWQTLSAHPEILLRVSLAL